MRRRLPHGCDRNDYVPVDHATQEHCSTVGWAPCAPLPWAHGLVAAKQNLRPNERCGQTKGDVREPDRSSRSVRPTMSQGNRTTTGTDRLTLDGPPGARLVGSAGPVVTGSAGC